MCTDHLLNFNYRKVSVKKKKKAHVFYKGCGRIISLIAAENTQTHIGICCKHKLDILNKMSKAPAVACLAHSFVRAFTMRPQQKRGKKKRP